MIRKPWGGRRTTKRNKCPDSVSPLCAYNTACFWHQASNSRNPTPPACRELSISSPVLPTLRCWLQAPTLFHFCLLISWLLDLPPLVWLICLGSSLRSGNGLAYFESLSHRRNRCREASSKVRAGSFCAAFGHTAFQKPPCLQLHREFSKFCALRPFFFF